MCSPWYYMCATEIHTYTLNHSSTSESKAQIEASRVFRVRVCVSSCVSVCARYSWFVYIPHCMLLWFIRRRRIEFLTFAPRSRIRNQSGAKHRSRQTCEPDLSLRAFPTQLFSISTLGFNVPPFPPNQPRLRI